MALSASKMSHAPYRLAGGTTDLVMSGTPGPDTLDGTMDPDSLSGLGGADTIIGRAGNDVLDGGADNDYIRGDAGDDTLLGGDGHDYLRGGAGDDLIDGGAGIDRAAFFDSPLGVHVSLLLQGVVQDTGQGFDLLTKIENLSGTRYDDRLEGDSGDNWLWGDISAASPATGGGNDTLIGNGGNDLLDVGTGNHRLLGGGGQDAVSVFGGQSDTLGPVTLDLTLQGAVQDTGQGMMFLKGVERLSGSIHGDTLTGDGANNILAGHDGGDTLSGGAGADILYGDGAIRVFVPEGTSGPIIIEQQVLYDIKGVADPAGQDVLLGGDGRDILLGGFGADTLTGGAGADTFAYRDIADSTPNGPDFITDFTKRDIIDLKAIDADVTTAANDAFHFVSSFSGAAGEAVLEYDPDNGITYLWLDVNGDAVADGLIKIEGHAHEFDGFVL